jgi:glutamate/aspartate transport system substrate-binding protein
MMKKHLLAFAVAAVAAGSAFAQAGDTLAKIKSSGSITLGVRESSGLGYTLGNGKYVGFHTEMAEHIVSDLQKQLGLAKLDIKYQPVTSQNRVPLVQNGTVDLECGSTTNNVERQRQVDFSVGIFEVGTRLLTKKSSGVNDFEDLKGKNVVTTAGTTSERLLKSMNAEKKMGMNVISAKDHGESFLMLESNRAVAFMMDDALLAGEMAKAKKPDDWHVVGTPQSFEIYGCMVRKGDEGFKKVVDKAITDTFASGEINDIYNKWFQQPVPPKGLNLNFPMSDELKKLIAEPTDKSVEQI